MVIVPRESLGTGIAAGWLLLAMTVPLGYALSQVLITFIRPAATTSMQLTTGVLLTAALIFLPGMLIVDGHLDLAIDTLLAQYGHLGRSPVWPYCAPLLGHCLRRVHAR